MKYNKSMGNCVISDYFEVRIINTIKIYFEHTCVTKDIAERLVISMALKSLK